MRLITALVIYPAEPNHFFGILEISLSICFCWTFSWLMSEAIVLLI